MLSRRLEIMCMPELAEQLPWAWSMSQLMGPLIVQVLQGERHSHLFNRVFVPNLVGHQLVHELGMYLSKSPSTIM